MAYQQPWLHELVTVLRAPTVALSARDGQIHEGTGEGVLHADIRVLSHAVLTVDGQPPTHLAAGLVGATGDGARFTAVARNLGDPTPDPTVRVDRIREVRADSMTEHVVFASTAEQPIHCTVSLDVAADHAGVVQLRYGAEVALAPFEVVTTDGEAAAGGVSWSHPSVRTTLRAPGAKVSAAAASRHAEMHWDVTIDPGHSHTLVWTLELSGTTGPFSGAPSADPWTDVTVCSDDHRLPPLVSQSLKDLAALRMVPAERTRDEFLAAGSPWYFTLFGRDSIWAARLMLPFGTEIARGTLRALVALQGTTVNDESAEEPGKIPHEQRAAASVHAGDTRAARAMQLPPLYYGTVDATPLWICLLHDAWRWGLPEDQVGPLIPALQGALGWLRDFGDPDSDGFLEYVDKTGTGLANQGWKDSGDSIRFADGTIAEGPVALCEVQGYAYEAAMHGAQLLDAFGEPGAEEWRGWAAALRRRFRAAFWVNGRTGRFPALALDGTKRPVDSLTSNIGHLLGTGILDEDESALVAALISGPELYSGFGLRTMSNADGGYSALSYHCGSVWPHDTAIAIRGLAAEGHLPEACTLIDGLLSAGVAFSGRLPELFGGDAASDLGWPVPYPASCRPQAWSAAAVGAIVEALLGLRIEGDAATLKAGSSGSALFGGVDVSGVRLGSRRLRVSLDRDGRAAVSDA